jgi:hypothetical protein
MTFLVADGTGHLSPVDLLARSTALSRHMAFLTTVAAGHLARVRAVGGEMIFFTAVAAGALLLVGAILRAQSCQHELGLKRRRVGRVVTYLGKMFLRLADLAGTVGLLALLSTVANAVTDFSTQEAGDGRLDGGDSLLRAATSSMTKLVAVVALGNTAIHRDTGIGKAGEIVLGRRRPLADEVGTSDIGGGEVRDSILLVDIALQVDIGQGVTVIFLHGDHVDAETTAAEFFFELGVGVVRAGLGKDLDRIFEVANVTLFAGL